MITLRPAEERGHANHGWLDSHHTFSFADYHDERHMGFRALRVINEDRVEPGRGFGTHAHQDMEIISYVLDGALQHRDSLGNGSILRPDEVQRMSAGRGVTHSEFNPSNVERVHFLQIWILPNARGLPPSYEQRRFPSEDRRGRLRLLAAADGRDGAVTIHQDVDLYGTVLEGGQQVRHDLRPGRHAWVQVARGSVDVNGHPLAAGDGAALSDERGVELHADAPSEVLLFDLA
jgi:quercetin 2,3-dioxygenase